MIKGFAFFFFCPFLLISTTAVGEAGDAHLFGGGDPFEQRIENLRRRMTQALGLLAAGFDQDNLCAPSKCDNRSGMLCEALRAQSIGQQKICEAYILSHSSQYVAQSAKTRSVLSQKALSVRERGGKVRQVSAFTPHGPNGAISFHRESVVKMSDGELLMLLGHELGHKVGNQGLAILDSQPSRGFESGKQFLDTVGAALAIYVLEHSVPSQSPKPFAKLSHMNAFCRVSKKATDQYIFALGVQLLDQSLTDQQIQLWKSTFKSLGANQSSESRESFVRQISSSTVARGNRIKGWFRRYLLRDPNSSELEMMMERLNQGVPEEAIVASLMGDEEYAKKRMALGPQQLAVSYYQDIVGRLPTQTELNWAIGGIQYGDRPTTALSIMGKHPRSRERRVDEWFETFLNRAPSTKEKSEYYPRMLSGAGWEAIQSSILAKAEYISLQGMRLKGCHTDMSPRIGGIK